MLARHKDHENGALIDRYDAALCTIPSTLQNKPEGAAKLAFAFHFNIVLVLAIIVTVRSRGYKCLHKGVDNYENPSADLTYISETIWN